MVSTKFKLLVFILACFSLFFVYCGDDGDDNGNGNGNGDEDVTAPVVEIITPENGSTVTGETVLIAEAYDSVGVVEVVFYIDGAEYFSDVDSPWTTDWDASGLEHESMHSIYCKAYDSVSNEGVSDTITVMVENPSFSCEMLEVPAGNFTRGDVWGSGDFDETPTSTIYLDGFQISKYEITNAEYALFIEDSGYYKEEYWDSVGWSWIVRRGHYYPEWWEDGDYNCGPDYPDYPIVGVMWHEANAFANWAGARLPTEAEWEKAARGTGPTDGYEFPWGNVFFMNVGGDTVLCNYGDGLYPDFGVVDGFEETSPVGNYAGGASPYGAYDMAGNVAEWCSDWYSNSYYGISGTENPQGPENGSAKVYRGGSWISDPHLADPTTNPLRTCTRESRECADRKKFIGFRIVKDL